MGTSMMTNIPKSKSKNPSNGNFLRDFPRKEGLLMQPLNLKFDPAKDEVEEFMTNVKNLAATLEFNEEAQKVICQEMCMVCACSTTIWMN